MSEWHEFRLWYDTNATPDALFLFKKVHLIPLLTQSIVQDFLMLDEAQFVVLRIEAEDKLARTVEASLNKLIQTIPSLFREVTRIPWSPQQDARERITSARKRAGIPSAITTEGWKLVGKNQDGSWIAEEEDFDRQIEVFSKLLSRVVGKFTRAYVEQVPYRVNDRWLLSVLLHLLLDSVSIHPGEEKEVRACPYW